MLNLLSIDSSLRSFFNQLTESLGFAGFLGVFLGVEALFIIIFAIRATLSYEARLKRSLDKVNEWLFKNKVITEKNIKEFNELIKTGPKRLVYFWQQYILYREGAPSSYMTIENIIEKPIRTSNWQSSIKNLSIASCLWAAFALIFGLASQATNTWSFQYVAVSLVLPCSVLLIGLIAVMIIKSVRSVNLEDIYHFYHIFARFVDNACAELPDFIDFNLLFTQKDIENGNPQLREHYEAMARKAKEEFENARKNDIKFAEYSFKDVGMDGQLLLTRAMNESEVFTKKQASIMSEKAQLKSQLDALQRTYETKQMDLQRKIQASKENIRKLIEQQAATTSRIEVGLLRQQQEKESKKQEELQKDYDTEENKFRAAKAEIDQKEAELDTALAESRKEAETNMSSEYQTFYEKVMKSAYAVAEKKALDEKKELKKQSDKNEKELINVQTQIKRLMDENLTLREKLEKLNPEYKEETQNAPEGHYDDEGNFIYADGSYHSVADGYFHDVDGRVYDMNGVEVTAEITEGEGVTEEALKNSQINQFGSYVAIEEKEEKAEEKQTPIIEDYSFDEIVEEKPEEIASEPEEKPAPIVEEYNPDEDLTENKVEEVKEEVKEEKPAEEKTDAPAKKRGRPRKVVTEEPKKEEPKKSRGRPRKQVAAVKETKEEKIDAPAKKRGRPRKTTATEPAKKTTTAKRGRPKGSVKKTEPTVAQEPKKRGRPRKSPILGEDIDSLEKISKLISEEEDKLNKMKALLSSEIDEVLKEEKQEQVDKEREDLIKAVEALKAQAATANQDTKTEELANINSRLEDLIKEISKLNNKK